MKNYNLITGNLYQGENQVVLESVRVQNNYKSNAWVTFLQANQKNLKIKKGSKAVTIFNGFSTGTKKVKEGDKEVIKNVPIINGYSKVFNLEQTEKKEDK